MILFFFTVNYFLWHLPHSSIIFGPPATIQSLTLDPWPLEPKINGQTVEYYSTTRWSVLSYSDHEFRYHQLQHTHIGLPYIHFFSRAKLNVVRASLYTDIKSMYAWNIIQTHINTDEDKLFSNKQTQQTLSTTGWCLIYDHSCTECNQCFLNQCTTNEVYTQWKSTSTSINTDDVSQKRQRHATWYSAA